MLIPDGEWFCPPCQHVSCMCVWKMEEWIQRRISPHAWILWRYFGGKEYSDPEIYLIRHAFIFLCCFFSLSLEAAVWQTRGTASEPRQCTEEKRAVGAKVKQATPGKTPLKSSKQRQECLSRLAFYRRERLVYVGISVENIIPVSRSQRLKSHNLLECILFFFSRSPCKKILGVVKGFSVVYHYKDVLTS